LGSRLRTLHTGGNFPGQICEGARYRLDDRRRLIFQHPAFGLPYLIQVGNPCLQAGRRLWCGAYQVSPRLHVGTIAMRVGNPPGTDPWEWICGFYPGCHPGEHQNATAATFDHAPD
jgi:hypothetical protein